jgi:hypothetical protein
MPSLGGQTVVFARVPQSPPSGEVCPEVCPEHARRLSSSLFMITDSARVAEQQKRLIVDQES